MEEPNTPALAVLQSNFRQEGRVAWIGLRAQRRTPLNVVEHTTALAGRGLEGDRSAEKAGSKRQVTLIMGEHLDATAAILGIPQVDPGLTRRNIVTRGINLMALKQKRFRVGQAIIELTDPCHPCSRMEENLGHGGYNAMRGHGGWCAIILQDGDIHLGDPITPITE